MKDVIKVPLMIAGGVAFMLSLLFLMGLLFTSGDPASTSGVSNAKWFYFFLMWFFLTMSSSMYMEKWFGDEPQIIWVTSIILGVIFPVLWLGFNNILTSNILGILFLVSAFMLLPKIPLKVAIMIGVGMVIYDWIAVFETELMMKMASVAIAEYIPLLLYLPNFSDFWGPPMFALGLGDIVVPGLIIKAEIGRAKEHDLPRLGNMPLFPFIGIVGYLAGTAIAIVAVFVFKAAQPALIYIIPTMLIYLLVAYAVTGEFKQKEMKED